MHTFKKAALSIMAIALVLALTACGSPKAQTKQEDANAAQAQTITVFSGAGLKKPMEEIKKEFETRNNVKIEYTYGGSAQLLSQIELSNKGDVFITGSLDSYNAANKKGLVGPYKKVALHIPVIGVQSGNPKGIKGLEDLAAPGVKVVIGDEKANAIGAAAQRIIKKTGLAGINANVIAKTATVNEIVLHLVNKDADAAIITADSAKGNKDVEVIQIPESMNSIETVPVCALKSSKDADMANKFVDFVASPEGKDIFKKYGFTPVE